MKRILKIVLPLIGVGPLVKYILTGLFSGLCNFLFINSVTKVVGLTISGSFANLQKEYCIIFAMVILVFVWTRKTLSLAIIKLSQQLFWTLRKQILSLVLNTNYQQLSSRKPRIYSAIVTDVNILTDASMGIIDFFIAAIMAVSCLAYLASISLMLFFITLGIVLTGTSVYYVGSKKNIKDFEKARKLENSFLENFNAMINGFKEIFMEPKKGRAIYNDKIELIAAEAAEKNTTAFAGFLFNQIIGQVLFYILISSILLFFSILFHIPAASTVSFIFTLLYLLTSVEIVMVMLPRLMRAKIAANHLVDLKNEMEQVHSGNTLSEKYISKDDFEQISIRDLEFHYGKENETFGIGPINLELNKGEVIFIYGGNGSGKTTFIHTVLGLRVPSSGEIRLNDIVVNNTNYPEYRTSFAVVFSDFYLFDELLGLASPDMDRWGYLIELFELTGKVKIDDRKFSTTELSTGQRKRLALIAALMEEKPVLVIDEWAADQDPYFRKKFYTEIIPLLKKEGITIIAITHDDNYYHCADRLYKMNEGKLIEENIRVFQSSLVHE